VKQGDELALMMITARAAKILAVKMTLEAALTRCSRCSSLGKKAGNDHSGTRHRKSERGEDKNPRTDHRSGSDTVDGIKAEGFLKLHNEVNLLRLRTEGQGD